MAAPVTAATVRALICPHCGGAVTIRGMSHTRTVACERCGSLLDARDPGLRILQEFDRRTAEPHHIPLGTRGQWRGAPYEVIGFMVRAIVVEGTTYSWGEYLLFNPYHGFRYLTEYQGHWNDVVALHAVPAQEFGAGKPEARLADGSAFSHFQAAKASTTYVLGEFPWEVRVGDEVEVDDFVAPPRVLSREHTAEETTWSLGEYVSGREVWRAFALDGKPPHAHGVYANQPSPHAERARAMRRTFFALVTGFIVILAASQMLARRDQVFSEVYTLQPGAGGAGAAFVTEPFELRGRTSDVEMSISTDVQNSWIFLDFALIDERTGRAYDFGREVSFYNGVDGGEAWTEGKRVDRALVGSIPSGRYYLRVEPHGPPEARLPVSYRLTLRRDVPPMSFFWIALALLALPPVVSQLRAMSFEQQRWAESDYAGE